MLKYFRSDISFIFGYIILFGALLLSNPGIKTIEYIFQLSLVAILFFFNFILSYEILNSKNDYSKMIIFICLFLAYPLISGVIYLLFNIKSLLFLLGMIIINLIIFKFKVNKNLKFIIDEVKKFRINTSILLITIIVRYPIFNNNMNGVDGFEFFIYAREFILKNIYFNDLNFLSLIEFYPLSLIIGPTMSISFFSNYDVIFIENCILFLSYLVGLMSAYSMKSLIDYIYVNLEKSYINLISISYSVSPIIVRFSDWTINGRVFFFMTLPLILLLLKKYEHGINKNNSFITHNSIILKLIIFILLFYHRIIWFLLPIFFIWISYRLFINKFDKGKNIIMALNKISLNLNLIMILAHVSIFFQNYSYGWIFSTLSLEDSDLHFSIMLNILIITQFSVFYVVGIIGILRSNKVFINLPIIYSLTCMMCVFFYSLAPYFFQFSFLIYFIASWDFILNYTPTFKKIDSENKSKYILDINRLKRKLILTFVVLLIISTMSIQGIRLSHTSNQNEKIIDISENINYVSGSIFVNNIELSEKFSAYIGAPVFPMQDKILKLHGYLTINNLYIENSVYNKNFSINRLHIELVDLLRNPFNVNYINLDIDRLRNGLDLDKSLFSEINLRQICDLEINYIIEHRSTDSSYLIDEIKKLYTPIYFNSQYQLFNMENYINQNC